MYRLRVRFKRGEEIKFISHLDLIRLWQRAIHRSGLPLSYSKGFSPHPKISLAAALAVGVTSDAELADIYLDRLVSPHFFVASLNQQLPSGIEIIQVYPIPIDQPSLQSQTSSAEYSIIVETGKEMEEIESSISKLLSREHIPWQHQRDKCTRCYDLRELIYDLWLIDKPDHYCIIGMRLRCDSSGSGRPEQVAIAMGFNGIPKSIHRTGLFMKQGKIKIENSHE